MGSALRRAAGGWVLLLGCGLTACTYAPEPSLLFRDDRPARSQTAVDKVVGGETNPGCAAAVGERGKVLWRGQRGLAVVEPATPITKDTTFDIGSISKQFTALSAALLAKEGRLSLDDSVADHLTGYPSWSEQVTIDQLIHHTSGIPDLVLLARNQGIDVETEVSRAELLEAIAAVDEPDVGPGSRWAYSDSNYLLLGMIVEQVTDRPLSEHLQQTFFTPLDLAMTLDWPGPADRTRSYRGGPKDQFEIADVPAEAPGSSGIRSTPTELVRWGDIYRTGAVAGGLVTEPEQGAVDGTGNDSAYGLGIMITPDGTLWHDSQVGGFQAIFGVSPDRELAIAVTCNTVAIDPFDIAAPLIEIWTPT